MQTSNGVKKLFFIAILSLFFPAVSFAQVSKIVFTTDPQSIRPNTLSNPLTIQTQDSGGDSFQTPETIDLQFISTSATGEFLNSSGNPATTYMSRNTANRTFYYKDSTEGTFTITVNVRGRDTGIELDVSQQIIISSNASQSSSGDNSNSSGEVLGASSSSSSSSSSQSSGSSATNVPSLNSQLEIIAGNDRTTSPGSPIWFQATVKKNTTSASPELNWSFGDGNIGVGPLVGHTYKYPGDYAVVLSAKAGDMFSVSRLKVKVVESSISVSDKNEYLEISNNGSTEVNLFNWKVENNGKGFVFQPNTIILPHSSIKLDKSLLKMKGYDNSLGTSLKNGLREEVFSIAPVEKANLSEVSKSLDNIKKEFSTIQEKAKNLGLTSHANISSTISINRKVEERADTIYSLPASTSIGDVIYEAPKTENFFKRTWEFITGLFN